MRLTTENKFKQYAKQHKKATEEIVTDALKIFLDINNQNNELNYTKKNPMEHLRKIKYNDENDSEDLSDVKLYSHVVDTAQYVHNLRRTRTK